MAKKGRRPPLTPRLGAAAANALAHRPGAYAHRDRRRLSRSTVQVALRRELLGES